MSTIKSIIIFIKFGFALLIFKKEKISPLVITASVSGFGIIFSVESSSTQFFKHGSHTVTFPPDISYSIPA